MFRFCCSFKRASLAKSLFASQEAFAQPRNLHIKSFNQNLNGLLTNNDINQESRRYAGHSKWKNIKATKEAKDDIKQRITCLLCKKVKIAITEGGGETNPKHNPLLARVMDQGRNNDVPLATLNRAIENYINKKSRTGSPTQVEARSINGVSFIIETMSDRMKHFRCNVQFVMKKHGGRLVEEGVCVHNFTRKGAIYVPAVPMSEKDNKDYVKLDSDKAFEVALEGGAEDVVKTLDEEDETMFKFVCDMQEFSNVKRYIEEQNLKPSEARLEFIPNFHVAMEEAEFDLVEKIKTDLEELDDTEVVYHNAQPTLSE